MAKRDELLFDVFESLREETRGIVVRGGIFTAQHPRLRGVYNKREISIFFQYEKGAYFLCIRISHLFPATISIKPRYRAPGLLSLDIELESGRIESNMPFPFHEHFIISSDNDRISTAFVNSETFIENFQDLLSPGALEHRFFKKFRQDENPGDMTERKTGIEDIEKELDKMTVPRMRFFFYPSVLLDRKGAFLKVRFDQYHETNKKSLSERDVDDYRSELREVITGNLNALHNLLEEGALIQRLSGPL